MTAAMAHVSSESIHEAVTGLSSNGVLVRDAFPRRNPAGARDKRPIKGTAAGASHHANSCSQPPQTPRGWRSPVGWLVTPGVERRLDRVGVEPASGEQGVEAPSPEARIEPGGAPRGLGEDPPGLRQLVQGTTLRFEQLSPAGHIRGTDPAAPQLLLEPAPA